MNFSNYFLVLKLKQIFLRIYPTTAWVSAVKSKQSSQILNTIYVDLRSVTMSSTNLVQSSGPYIFATLDYGPTFSTDFIFTGWIGFPSMVSVLFFHPINVITVNKVRFVIINFVQSCLLPCFASNLFSSTSSADVILLTRKINLEL